jgi:hypothetical protein
MNEDKTHEAYIHGWNAAIEEAHKIIQQAALRNGWDTCSDGYECDYLVQRLYMEEKE